MIPPDEQITKEQAIQRVKEITIATSDSYIENYEDEIRYSHEQEKLSLWIIGLIIGIELFMLSRLEKDDFSTWISVILACLISGVTCWAGVQGLFTKLKKTRLISKYLDTITSYRYQKSNILLNLNSNTGTRIALLEDLSSGLLVDKIFKFEYVERKPYVFEERTLQDIERLKKAESNRATYLEAKKRIQQEHKLLAEEYKQSTNYDKNYLENSHKSPSTLIIIQVALTTIYYIYLTYQ